MVMVVTGSVICVERWRFEDISYRIRLVFLFLCCFATASNHIYCSEENTKSDCRIMKYGESLVLKCGEPDSSVKWSKDEKPLETNSRIVVDKNTLSINEARGEDVAVYSCSFQNPESGETQASFNVIATPLVKVLPEDVVVVEGDNLKLECLVKGKPEPKIQWRVGNKTYIESEDRVTLSNNTENEIIRNTLEMEEVEMSDRGEIVCIASNDAGKTEATAFIRVRGQYAAIWPFLGILLEVIILCAVIFICNKKCKGSDSDDSDTDENDQQNHKQNPRNDSVRQRK